MLNSFSKGDLNKSVNRVIVPCILRLSTIHKGREDLRRPRICEKYIYILSAAYLGVGPI